MASITTRITGLWAKPSKAGTIISGALKPEAKAALLAALASDDLLEVVIFENQRRDKETSPTHNFCIGAGRQPRPEAARTPGDDRAPGRSQGFGDDFIGGRTPEPEDDTAPF